MIIETKKNKATIVSLYLLAFASALYMFEAVQVIIMAIASLFLLLQYRSAKNFFSIKKVPFLLSFFVLLCFNLFYFNNKSIQVIANSFLLFIVPLFSSFLYESDFFIKNKQRILLTYCFSITLISIFIVCFYINDIPNHHFNWYFARFNLENTIHIHGTYISLWVGIAILLVSDFLIHDKTLNTKIKTCLILVIALLLLSLIVINTRIILYSIIFLSALNYYFFAFKSKKMNSKVVVIMLLLISLVVLFLSQRFQDDIQFLNKNNIKNSSRYTICYCSLQTIAESNFLGMDNHLIQSKLNNCYDKYGFSDLSKDNLNAHNQYLDFFLKGGFVLFILFVLMLFIKLKTALKSKNYLYFLITLLFTFSFLTENILVRQYGIYIYMFCDILFLGSVLPNKSHCTNKIEKS
ncbi:O-antigen ligase family protein [Flavobacterium piscisymbiosum]|uniref:O-antigen ligase family protein n=1 Tax=Flavobacterium piscisymbiosum TaxID=2893753 RepID=A0ABS8MAK0_9FLAO|nr:O-antigen ligase family protein [Flavobacterium sp. F-30]MCC9062468.1 O-antigen ligase family protein [Flavobacterium sp. F-30]